MKIAVRILFSFAITVPCVGQNFHKIYPFDDTIAISHNIHVTDSCYYLGGTSAFGTATTDVVLTKLDLSGNQLWLAKDVTPGSLDIAFGGRTQLDTNFRGNFMHGYTNRIFGQGWFPCITEMDYNGNTINYFNFDFWEQDSVYFYDSGRIVVNNPDSSYYGFFTYRDETSDSNDPPGFDGETGCMLFKVNWLGDTLWTKKIHHPAMYFGKPAYLVRDIDILQDQRLFLTFTEFDQPGGTQNEWAKTHFMLTDLSGNVLEENVFFDTQFCYSAFESHRLSDGRVLTSYFKSLIQNNGNTYYWFHKPVLALLDSNYQIIWKEDLVPEYANLFYSVAPSKFRFIDDSTFSGTYTWFDIDWDDYKLNTSVRIFKRTIDGNEIWHRDYYYWPYEDGFNEPEYTLMDFELTPDGGFITCGDVKNFDSLATGGQGQYAYVLKTNCLGFLGEPEAAISHEILDDFMVAFYNTSTQAGEYYWDFGDGETLVTGEQQDTIYHTYSGFGIFEVTLIASGCNGAADTLSFVVEPAKHADPTPITNGNGYFTFFPNPVVSGTQFYVYLNGLNPEKGEVFLQLYAMNGQLAERINLSASEGLYLIDQRLSSGIYVAALFQGQELLQERNLVVE